MTQVWLITGSSRGLGRALAEAVLKAGHKLVATARNPGQLADLRRGSGGHGQFQVRNRLRWGRKSLAFSRGFGLRASRRKAGLERRLPTPPRAPCS